MPDLAGRDFVWFRIEPQGGDHENVFGLVEGGRKVDPGSEFLFEDTCSGFLQQPLFPLFQPSVLVFFGAFCGEDNWATSPLEPMSRSSKAGTRLD